MCGIFAYLNYLTPKTRKEIIDFLITGLQRLEYRGYDSAGNIFDSHLFMIKNDIVWKGILYVQDLQTYMGGQVGLG